MFALLALSSFAFASTALDLGAFAGSDEFTPMMSLYSSAAMGESNFSTFAFGMATPGWGQAYAGVGWAPTDWLSIELGAGLETVPDAPWRVGGDVWIGHDKWSLLMIGEVGGSGPWYKAIGRYNATDWLTLGAMSVAPQGHGPRLELHHKSVTLYGAALWKDELVPIAHGGLVLKW